MTDVATCAKTAPQWRTARMIVDFQHHFTPRELIKEDPGDRLILNYDASGAPSYTIHSLLYDLDEHVRMMDVAGIDAAWLTSAPGMCADLATSSVSRVSPSPRNSTANGSTTRRSSRSGTKRASSDCSCSCTRR